MAFTEQELQSGFWVGDRHVEPRQNRISAGTTEVRLERRVMDVLVCLAEQAGEVVSRDTLNQRVWANVVVTDQAVTNCISELRQHLGDHRSANRVIETIPKRGYRLVAPVRLASGVPEAAALPAPRVRRSRLPLVVTLTGMCLAAVAAFWFWLSRPEVPAVSSVAVLRFENASGSPELDYLSLSLSDETATLLTRSRDLAVRPFNYVSGEDPLASARDRRVDLIVTGRYYQEDGARLSLAIEALRVAQDRVIWRTRLTAAAGDLLALRERLSEGVRHGLLPAIGAQAAPLSASAATDGDAYLLYMRSLAIPQQPKPTERAIEMLERAVELEPGFAQAWAALGVRYYALGTWYAGGRTVRARSLAAHRKALELDPNLLFSAQSIVTLRAESGDLAGAYQEASELLERFGPHPETLFALSYVLRYGGLLKESQRRCEQALALDPQDPRLRSCGYAYLYAGDLSRVMDYLQLDEGSYFVHWANVLYQLRRGDRAAALQAARLAADEPNEPTRRLMEPCLEGATGAELDAPIAEFVAHWQISEDPEAAYGLAPMLKFCGRTPEALRFIERAIDGGFCAYPAMDLDPIWEGLRTDPDFQRIRVKAMACHERFRREVGTSGLANP